MSVLGLATADFGESSGPGRPLLVLGPSLGTSVESLWGSCVPLLSSGFRVVGWDLPGHGRSPAGESFTVADLAAAVLRLVDDLAGPGAVFHYAGDSLGGAVGLQLALDAPSRVASATLVCTAARIGEPAAWLERAATVRAGGTAALLDSTPARWFGPAFAYREPAVARNLLEALAAADAGSYAAACQALADFDVRGRLGEIGIPVTAVAGSQDSVIPTAAVHQIATGVQHGRLVTLDGVAHLAPAEVPAQIAKLITEAKDAIAVGRERSTEAGVWAAGTRVRREVLGPEHADRTLAQTTDFTRDFQDLITRYAWGTIWTRPGLDRRSRSLITLTALVARGHHDELALHLRAARRNGLTAEEIKEALLQTAVYCGVPDANTAFRIAAEVLADIDPATSTGPDSAAGATPPTGQIEEDL